MYQRLLNYHDLFSFTLITNHTKPCKNKFVWVHGDEVTARDTLVAYISQVPDTILYQAFFINNQEQRELKIGNILVDPNRIFSKTGLINNLIELNPNQDLNYLHIIAKQILIASQQLLQDLLPLDGGFLCALHNNSRGYSINDELTASSNIAFNNKLQPHDFFICTTLNDFKYLEASPYNAVLNNKSLTIDDGSLGAYMVHNDSRYINLEVALGYKQLNQTMLTYLMQYITM